MDVGWEPAQVAVSYFANRPAGGRDGYVSVTHDAFAENPVIHAATLNPPSEPMLTQPGGVSHYVSVDFAPDGTPWGAFWTDCVQNGEFVDKSCAENEGNGWTNFPEAAHAMTVGRLLFE